MVFYWGALFVGAVLLAVLGIRLYVCRLVERQVIRLQTT